MKKEDLFGYGGVKGSIDPVINLLSTLLTKVADNDMSGDEAIESIKNSTDISDDMKTKILDIVKNSLDLNIMESRKKILNQFKRFI